jgi:hypothetical protein
VMVKRPLVAASEDLHLLFRHVCLLG